MRNNFLTAQDAFEYYYDYISGWGKPFDKTNTVFNVGFSIENPLGSYLFHFPACLYTYLLGFETDKIPFHSLHI